MLGFLAPSLLLILLLVTGKLPSLCSPLSEMRQFTIENRYAEKTTSKWANSIDFQINLL